MAQAFFAALDTVPDLQRTAVARAAQLLIRDELKSRRDKAKAMAARAKAAARPVRRAARPKVA